MERFILKSAGRYFGINAQFIHRVIDEVIISPAPLVPSCHLGLIFYQGEVFDVIHMAMLFGQKGSYVAGSDPVVLLKWSQKKVALVPDEIMGLIWLEDGDGKKSHYTNEGYNVELVSPDEIWTRLLEIPYGPHKV